MMANTSVFETSRECARSFFPERDALPPPWVKRESVNAVPPLSLRPWDRFHDQNESEPDHEPVLARVTLKSNYSQLQQDTTLELHFILTFHFEGMPKIDKMKDCEVYLHPVNRFFYEEMTKSMSVMPKKLTVKEFFDAVHVWYVYFDPITKERKEFELDPEDVERVFYDCHVREF